MLPGSPIHNLSAAFARALYFCQQLVSRNVGHVIAGNMHGPLAVFLTEIKYVSVLIVLFVYYEAGPQWCIVSPSLLILGKVMNLRRKGLR